MSAAARRNSKQFTVPTPLATLPAHPCVEETLNSYNICYKARTWSIIQRQMEVKYCVCHSLNDGIMYSLQ